MATTILPFARTCNCCGHRTLMKYEQREDGCIYACCKHCGYVFNIYPKDEDTEDDMNE